MSTDAARRRALRFAIYINLLGRDPVRFNHGGYGKYEFALQEQFAIPEVVLLGKPLEQSQ